MGKNRDPLSDLEEMLIVGMMFIGAIIFAFFFLVRIKELQGW